MRITISAAPAFFNILLHSFTVLPVVYISSNSIIFLSFIFSGFLFLNSITDQITFSTDNVILSSIGGTAAVAVYNVGSSFKVYFQNFSTSISSVFAPQVNQIVAQKQPMKKLDDIFTRVGRIQFYVISLVLIAGNAFFNLYILLYNRNSFLSFFIKLFIRFINSAC